MLLRARVRATSLALIVAGALLVGGVSAISAGPQAGGRLVYVLGGEPPSLDPHVSEAWFAFSVTNHLYDLLVVRDMRTKQVAASLATAWKISPDNKVWTFTLRRGVKFHDGTPFNAHAVKFSFDRIIDPKTKSPAAAPLLGGNLERTEVVDDYTVRFVLKRPFAGFLDVLTQSYGGLNIVSPTAVQRWGQDFGQHPVGTGPFMFKEWVPKDRIVLVRNPDYAWAPQIYGRNGPPYLEEIVVRFVAENTVRTAMLQSGQADVIWRVEESDAELIRRNRNLKVDRVLRPGTGSMMQINVQRPPTDDLRVRRALMHVINMDEVNKVVYNGEPENARTVISPNTVGFTAQNDYRRLYPLDPQRAATLFDEAGWRTNPQSGVREREGQPLRLVNICFPGAHCRIGEVMQAQLRAVNVQMEVRAMGQPANVQATQRGEHHLRSIGWGGTDAAQLLHFLYHSSNIGSGWNFTFYKDARLDEMLETATGELYQGKRVRMLAEIERYIFDRALSIPIFYYTWLVGYSNRVDGIFLDPVNALPILYNASIQRR